MITNIDSKTFQKMFLAGAKNLEAKKEWINELNVFPVPDGDTGTNMTLTIMAAAKEVGGIEEPTMENLAKAISSGSLRGARGNSGVIMSQLFRGFTREIKESKTIDAVVFANACEKAVETAYKAVMKPKEGTILTVARGMAEKAREMVMETDDLEVIFEAVINEGDYVLDQTPEMLPVLKQAGVVDSGGQGLMQVLKGGYDAFLGKELDLTIEGVVKPNVNPVNTPSEAADIKFGYCTEFIILLEKEFTMENEHGFKSYLNGIGDCVVVVSDDDIVKVHVHTNDPGLAIQKALTFGQLSKMKIDNMREEHNEKLIKDAEKAAKIEAEEKAETLQSERKDCGFIAVSVGEGLDEIFKGLGVDYLITGGQTMNPSTEDMLNAIANVNADNIFILPNNKNIILAAEQAKTLTEDKNIYVVPTKTIPQGITAVINYVQGNDAEHNYEIMKEEIQNVKTGQITYAVRDTNIDGKDIHENDIMGIGDEGIVSVGTEVVDTLVDMVSHMVDDDTEIVTLYYGSDVSEAEAETVAEKITEKYPDIDVDVNMGGQPIYYYIVSAE